MEDLGEMLCVYCVLFVLFWFGVGIKGKIFDVWRYGLFACTMFIGFEGCVLDVVEFWLFILSVLIDFEYGWGGFGDFINL